MSDGIRSMFGNKEQMLPVWPSLSKSPILTLFGWSTLAHNAFETNRALFSPTPLIQKYAATPACPTCVDPYAPIDGLLALHIRRGDFLEHCINLCHWNAAFNAFNQFDGFLDPWEGPQGSDDARMAVYLRRCVPTIEQIVDKVEAVRRSAAGQGLRNIYIMTNGERAWLEELKQALRQSHSWDKIATSRDMTLSWEQKYVSQTVDMLIGQRAQVLIGNGVGGQLASIAVTDFQHCGIVLQPHFQCCDAADVQRFPSRKYENVVSYWWEFASRFTTTVLYRPKVTIYSQHRSS